jgi:hypothetical protein
MSSKIKKMSVKKVKPDNSVNIVLTLIVIAIFIVALVGLYYAYKHYTDYSVSGKLTKMLINKIYDAKKHKHISSNSLPPSSQGHEFNINFWMFISDYAYHYNKPKIILNRTLGNNNSFTVQLDAKINSLSVIVYTNQPLVQTSLSLPQIDGFQNPTSSVYRTTTSTTASTTTGFITHPEKVTIRNIEIQRWNNVNISLINNYLNIFIDGELRQNYLFKGLSHINHTSLDVCPDGGFNGYLDRVSYTNKSLSKDEIMDIYKKGPSESKKI